MRRAIVAYFLLVALACAALAYYFRSALALVAAVAAFGIAARIAGDRVMGEGIR